MASHKNSAANPSSSKLDSSAEESFSSNDRCLLRLAIAVSL